MEIDKFIGIDPSFRGLGFSCIDVNNKVITFNELSVDVGYGSFKEISEASTNMTTLFNDTLSEYIDNNSFIGMEIPPVSGMYAVKLWALDTHLYNNISDKNVWLFNVPYLKFINKKYESKKDTKEMINQIIDVFKENDYKIDQKLKDKKSKDKKLTSNECDSFVYCIRMFVKYHYDNGIENPMLAEIININERFIEEKETILGKKIK